MNLQPNNSEVIKLNLDKSDDAGVITTSITSGGLIGAGLTIAVLQLPLEWQTVGLVCVPTLSSSITLIIVSMIRKLRRKTQAKVWCEERDNLVNYCDVAIPIANKGLRDLKDQRARELLDNSISRFQQLKALAIGAVPYERPWLTDEVSSAFPEPFVSSEIESNLLKIEESL
jgi:hypothetical protein